MYIFDTFDLSFFSTLVPSQKVHTNLSKVHLVSKLKEICVVKFVEGLALICIALFSERPSQTNMVVLAIALFLSQLANVCTTKIPAWLNVWETFFPTAV